MSLVRTLANPTPLRPCLAVLGASILGSWLLASAAWAQEPGPAASAPTAESAMALVTAERWPEAQKALEAVLAADPAQSQLWLAVGVARLRQGDAAGALEAYDQAAAGGVSDLGVGFRQAGAFAALGRNDEAFAALGRSLDAGFPAVARLEQDDDLAPLRDDPRFAEVLRRADVNARPCVFDPVYAQFDFWLGDWEVFIPGGQRGGHNHIEKVEHGCALTESWTSASGSTGRSVNFYDPGLGKWRQIWTDDRGSVIDVSGSFTDGAMRFEGEHRYPGGRVAPYRMTFFPNEDGTVRQLIEESSDGGETFAVGFDGLYKPVAPEEPASGANP